MTPYDTAKKICKELQEYADIEGAELGEACDLLIAMSGYVSYLGEDFYQYLIMELKAQLDNFKENAEIVEKTKTRVVKWKELEWV